MACCCNRCHFATPDRLHRLQMLYPDGTQYSSLSAPDFMSVRADQRVFEQVEAMDRLELTMLGAGEPREIDGAFVSGGVFEMLGLQVADGRGFRAGRKSARPRPGHASSATGSGSAYSAGIPQCSDARSRPPASPTRSSAITTPDSSLPEPAELYFPLEFGDTYDATTQQGAPQRIPAAWPARTKPGVTASRSMPT